MTERPEQSSINTDAFLRDQIDYYRARAGEYDEWFLRRGRYDRGATENAAWFHNVAELRRRLDAFRPTGNVLELACGTGLWTQQLVRYADAVTAIDAAAETLTINRARLQHERVTYVQADLFEWQPTRRYDVIFFSFWLSHVPPARFAPFWQMVDSALADNGRVFFIDSLHVESSTATNQHLSAAASHVQERLLNDGRRYQIVKIYYNPPTLTADLDALGWDVAVRTTPTYFLYGTGGRKS